jgi:glutathione S-transferase
MKPAHQNPQFIPSASDSAQKSSFKKGHKRGSEVPGFRASHKMPHAASPSIELYQKESCAASHAVRNKLYHLGLDFVAHSVPDDQPLKHEQLVRAGGKDQLPFLIDHTSGIKLYESSAILAYLDKSYGKNAGKDWLGKLTHLVDAQVRSWTDPIAWRLGSPLLRAQRFQLNARNALYTLSGSIEYVRSRFQAAVNEARAKTQGSRGTTDSEPAETMEQSARPLKTKKPVHPEVMSATGSA